MKYLEDKKLLLIIFSTLLLFGILIYISEERIVLKGKMFNKIEVNSNYKDPGVYVIKNFKITKKDINIKSNLNISKLGKYKIEYSTKVKNKKIKKTRYITVKDTMKPIIRLKGTEEEFICYNSEYKEQGYEAVDNYDNDISNKVKVTKNSNTISYKVRDSSGNYRVKIRRIKIKDIEKPDIKLIGNKEENIVINTPYNEKGVIVTDNCDKNIEKNIKKEGFVNTKKLGKYEIIYTVKDKSGNENSIKRIVNVIKSKKNKQKTIYLTFDDGPSTTVTNEILEILKTEKIKATFFVINHEPVTDYIIKKIYTEGHAIGLHSYSHNYSEIYSSEKAFFEDLLKIEKKVYNITSKKIKITRFPGGSSNTISRRYKDGIMSQLTLEIRNKGYQYFDWNVDSMDAGGSKTTDDLYYNIVNNLKENESIVLMHDTDKNNNTVTALKKVIKYAKENGYTFEKLDIKSYPAYQRVQN